MKTENTMKGKRILVAEDNELNSELIADILEIRGYLVLKATTGREAIEMAKKEMPDIILMDMQLPVMDGYMATRRIKQDPQLGDIPIVAITSYAMKGDKERILEAGCNGYIVKPIDTRKIIDQIEQFLRGGRSKR